MKITRQTLVIASMGSFSSGALNIKKKKKMAYINLFKRLGLFHNIIWSVSSKIEEADVKNIIGNSAECIIAEDLPRDITFEHTCVKAENQLNVIFLSRICEMKNLIGTIHILKHINNANIIFHIYGFLENQTYWHECEKELALLPNNIQWKYMGECNSNNVLETFANYDVFLFPTLGENYGHVISEALTAGCIPIISTNTPWQELNEHHCGKVISLNNINEFVDSLHDFIHMNQKEFNIFIANAQTYMSQKRLVSIKNTGYRRLFDS